MKWLSFPGTLALKILEQWLSTTGQVAQPGAENPPKGGNVATQFPNHFRQAGQFGHSVLDISIRFLCFNQAFCLFMPGRIVHNQVQLFLCLLRHALYELADTVNGCLKVKPVRLYSKKFTCLWDNESTVCHRLASRIGTNLGTTSFRKPLPGNGGFYCKMDFVLEYHQRIRILCQCFQFF